MTSIPSNHIALVSETLFNTICSFTKNSLTESAMLRAQLDCRGCHFASLLCQLFPGSLWRWLPLQGARKGPFWCFAFVDHKTMTLSWENLWCPFLDLFLFSVPMQRGPGEEEKPHSLPCPLLLLHTHTAIVRCWLQMSDYREWNFHWKCTRKAQFHNIS